MGSPAVRGGVLSAIGNTPLVKLSRLFPDAHFHLFAKLEALNPGGSLKDRPALAIIEDALREGAIAPGGVVVESSSGNMGIGLAQVCRIHDLRFVCVVDPKAARQNLQVLEAYGAEIVLVPEPDPDTGGFLQARLKKVEELLKEIPGSFWPNQYGNRNNPAAHYRSTMREVAEAMENEVDHLFVATSTCGTLLGCAEYIRDHDLGTRVIAVDAVGSQIFSDQCAPRNIPGIGAGIKPPLCDPTLVDDLVFVDDLDCVAGCRRLVDREAILAGGSSGGVVAAVARMSAAIPPGARCAVVLCDRGERYLDTIYSEEWVTERLGARPDQAELEARVAIHEPAEIRSARKPEGRRARQSRRASAG